MSFVRLRVRHLEMAKEACGEEKLSTQQDEVLQTRQNGACDVTKAGKDIVQVQHAGYLVFLTSFAEPLNSFLRHFLRAL